MKNTYLENKYHNFKTYRNKASRLKEVNWYDLPDSLCVEISGLKFRRKNVNIGTLKKNFGREKQINKNNDPLPT